MPLFLQQTPASQPMPLQQSDDVPQLEPAWLHSQTKFLQEPEQHWLLFEQPLPGWMQQALESPAHASPVQHCELVVQAANGSPHVASQVPLRQLPEQQSEKVLQLEPVGRQVRHWP